MFQERVDQHSREREAGTSAEIRNRADVLKQVYSPLLALVEKDPAAAAAAEEAERQQKELWIQQRDRLRERDPRAWDEQPEASFFRFNQVKPGFNAFSPPYSFRITGPYTEHGADVHSDAFLGRYGIRVGLNSDGGTATATAGVTAVLEAKATGLATIRAPLQYDYSWSISSSGGFSAHTFGGCEILVQDNATGAVLGPVGNPRMGLWNSGVITHNSGHSEASTIVPSDLQATVSVQAGKLFLVSFLATGFSTDSGYYLFGSSWASARLDMFAPWFVVQL